MNHFLPFGSGEYFVLLTILLFSRGMDVLSTWIGTPNLLLEGNPVNRWLGWRLGIAVNLVFSVAVAMWPLPCIILTTVGLMVAARNFQSAWLMRSMGEVEYLTWMSGRVQNSPGMFSICVIAQSILTALVGAPLMIFAPVESIVFAIGAGICGFAVANSVYGILSMRRVTRR
jgi:hypothetical protein